MQLRVSAQSLLLERIWHRSWGKGGPMQLRVSAQSLLLERIWHRSWGKGGPNEAPPRTFPALIKLALRGSWITAPRFAYSGGLGDCGDPSILFSGHIVARFVKVRVNVTNPKKTRRLQAPRYQRVRKRLLPTLSRPLLPLRLAKRN
jgi:hypothetical protein